MFFTCPSLSKATLSGTKATISYTTLKISKTEFESIFEALGVGASATITLSTNWGSPAATALACTTGVAGTTTITMASTAGIVVGDQITGTNLPITTPKAVTFQDTGDTVTLVAHGLSNGDTVGFSVITTTTGIVINTRYYVVAAAADTFQLSLTLGGGAIALTTNGTGSMRWSISVVSIVPNTSVTVNRALPTTLGAQTLSYRALKTNIAALKGWAIVG